MKRIYNWLLKVCGLPFWNVATIFIPSMTYIGYRKLINKMEFHSVEFMVLFLIGLVLAFGIYFLKRLRKLEEDRDIIDFLSAYRGGVTYGTIPTTREIQMNYNQVGHMPIPTKELIISEKMALRDHLLKRWNKSGKEVDALLDTMYAEYKEETTT